MHSFITMHAYCYCIGLCAFCSTLAKSVNYKIFVVTSTLTKSQNTIGWYVTQIQKWMKHEARFSNVATVARAYLAIPATSVASERSLYLFQMWLSCFRQTAKNKSAPYGTNCFRVSELMNFCYKTAMILTLLSLYELWIWSIENLRVPYLGSAQL